MGITTSVAGGILSLMTNAAVRSAAADLPHYRETEISSHGDRQQGPAARGLAGICRNCKPLASWQSTSKLLPVSTGFRPGGSSEFTDSPADDRSEEHTSELQSRFDLV